MVEEEKIDLAGEIEKIRNIGMDDVIKWQTLNCLRVANSEPEKLPVSVGMLERLLRNELEKNTEYYAEMEALEKRSNEIFEGWQRDERIAKERQIFFTMEKFALLISHITKTIPKNVSGVL